MPPSLKNLRLDIKVALMGAASVFITATALVILAVWQSGQYNRLAQDEVDTLINADLDHITQSAYNLVRAENEAVQLQIDNSLNVAEHVLSDAGAVTLSKDVIEWTAVNQFTNETREIKLPGFFLGKTWLGKNSDLSLETPVVDEITRQVGETATIFQRMNERGDMLRVATTVETSTNERAIGTYIPAVNPDGAENPVVSAVLKRDTYHGRAYVVNQWYLTAYRPIYNRYGSLVGMLYVGTKQKTVEDRVRQAILQVIIGKTGYVFVIGGKGEDRGRYIISYKGARDGEDVWMETDSNGSYVIQEIINSSISLNPGEMTTVRYQWQNQGEPEPRWKIARLVYYTPWDWVIGTTAYEDELQTYRAILSDGRLRMSSIMAIAGIIIAAMVAIAGIFLAWTIMRPVRHITGVAEKIIGGDLNQSVEVTSGDEIGILARTFNIMTGKLRQSMDSLKKSEEKYRSIFENALEGLFQNTVDGHSLSANPAMARILGYDSPDELISDVTDIGKEIYVNPLDRDILISTLIEQRKIFDFEVQMYRKDRTKIWVSISARMISDHTDGPAVFEGFITDISARRHAEEALAESRNYLNEIINTVGDPVFVKDRQHRWVLANDALCAFMGHPRSDILGKSDYDYFPENEADVFWSKDEIVLSTGKENINEESLTDAQGIVHTIVTKKTLYTDKNGEKFIVAIIRDTTDQKKAEEERKQLEARLGQAQKMEAVGTLAGGIAHDFNNILSVITGYTELAMLETHHNEKLHERLREVLTAGNRARDLVKQILAFSRMAETKYLPVKLRDIVSESLKMLRSVIPSNIEIRQNLSASGMIMSHPTQINQVMMNLCSNAVHAMGDTGGVLEIGLTDVAIDKASDFQGIDLAPGAYIKLSIRDTGKGMRPEIMEKIFEPYFTTKEPGRGTGLGLSVVHGIVKSHKGAITCKSSPLDGTVFDIYLPTIKSDDTVDAPTDEEPLRTGSERILFIDDEQVLADLSMDFLTSLGYGVVAKSSSIEALEVFREDPDGFDLVITDMTMPGMTGDRLARELIAIRHDIPVILCTGYNEHISEKRAKEIGIREFILKPMDLKKLAETIRKTLDRSIACHSE